MSVVGLILEVNQTTVLLQDKAVLKLLLMNIVIDKLSLQFPSTLKKGQLVHLQKLW